MLMESRMIVSTLALAILLLSFIASFKHQNSMIFIVGLIVCILLTRCDDWAPGMRQAVSSFRSKEDPAPPAPAPVVQTTTTKPVQPAKVFEKSMPVAPTASTVKLAPKVAPPPPAKPSPVSKENVTMSNRYDRPPADFEPNIPISPEDAQALFTTNISLLEKQGTEILDDRPRLGDFATGKASGTDLLKLVPDFPTMGHLLVGTLRTPDEPTFKVDREAEQNPEVLKLEKYGLVAGPDFFANCKTGGVIQTSVARDARDMQRCNRPGIY